MPENGMPGPVCDLSSVRESVCIHTKKSLTAVGIKTVLRV